MKDQYYIEAVRERLAVQRMDFGREPKHNISDADILYLKAAGNGTYIDVLQTVSEILADR